MSITKCDVIRDTANAVTCGMCNALTSGKPIPLGCEINGKFPPNAVCSIPTTANVRMKLFAAKYNPSNLFMDTLNKDVLIQTEKDYESDIFTTETDLANAYQSNDITNISWPDVEMCLWNKSGDPGGPNNNVYFERNDAQLLGMQSAYPIGGTFLENSIWKLGGKPSPVPLNVDYLINPDLFIIILIIILIAVLGFLIWTAWKYTVDMPYKILRDQQKKWEAHKTSYEPIAKWREYIQKMESNGFDMRDLRTKCGLPI